MKEKLYALNESDRRILNNLQRDMNEWRAVRGRGLPNPPLPDPGSRVFIAKVVTPTGIPAATSVLEPGVGQVALRKLLWERAASDSADTPDDNPIRYVRGVDGLQEDSTDDYIQYAYNMGNAIIPFETYVHVALLANGKYVIMDMPVTTEGAPSSGGVCGCYCVDAGDVEVDGIETVSQWQVRLAEVSEAQLNGRIYLPSTMHTLTLNEGSSSDSVAGAVGNWFKDVSSELVAEYNSGADATAATNPTGNIEFDRSVSGYTTMVLSIYGTVPDESTSGS